MTANCQLHDCKLETRQFINYQPIKPKKMGSFRDLILYQKAFSLAMDIFQESKKFPVDERYSLTSQICRSARSVCSNTGEGYRKRQYQKHFVSKLSDADMENTETQVWIDFAMACKYIDETTYQNWIARSEEIGRLLGAMIEHPEKFGSK